MDLGKAEPKKATRNDAYPSSKTLRNPISSLSPASPASALPIPHKSSTTPYSYPALDVSYPPQDADSPPAADVVQDFKAAAIHLLEHFSQDTSQSARKRESCTRIAHLVEESESHKAAALADAIISAIDVEHADKLVLLSTESPSLRLQHVTNLLAKQLSIVQVSSKIATAIDESFSKQQKALFLRQQLATINAELQPLEPGNTDLHGTGNGVEDEDEFDLLIRRVDTLPTGSEVLRLKRIPQNAEHGVLEWLTSLPRIPPPPPQKLSHDPISSPIPSHNSTRTIMGSKRSSAKAQEVTLKVIDDPAAGASEADGLKENACRAFIKASEIPAIPQVPVQVPPPQSLSKAKGIKAPILLKDFGQSIARTLGRLFLCIALGGVRHEAEIRGQRRTYVASSPGLLAQALRKASHGLGSIIVSFYPTFRIELPGDSSAALLEVLDPEQYVAFNKLHIARRFLLPKQLTQNGLSEPHVQPTEPTPLKTVTHYTREAGVHSLERSIGGIVQFKAVEWAAHVDAQGLAPSSLPAPLPTASESSDALVKRSKEGGVGYNPIVEADELEKILGLSRYDDEDREREARRGVVWGLGWFTCSLGDVIKESAELALSWVKTHSYDLGITSKRAQDPLRIPDAMIDIHLHLPTGAQKKDGPSAGVAMICAMVSLLTGKCVPPTTAMTGEITLRGRVSPVGGVKEKVLGAHRAGANKVIVPWANRKDVEHDVPKEVRARMQFVFARTVREVLDAAFGEGALPWRTLTPVVESRL
ncbi:ATP-dependent protease La [Lactarius deliciosus]|nr:ATP-dependent protease La [Lactarius deliciosus]